MAGGGGRGGRNGDAWMGVRLFMAIASGLEVDVPQGMAVGVVNEAGVSPTNGSAWLPWARGVRRLPARVTCR